MSDRSRCLDTLTRTVSGAQILLLALCVAGCTTGRMTLREVHYYAVSDETNTNYYRLNVLGDTTLGKAEYRSGWFPARAVDSLFGDVSADGSAGAYEARRAIETEIRDKVLSTYKAWLEEASRPDPDQTKLIGLMEARRRVLAYPSSIGEPFKDAFEIQYNPAQGVAILRSDEKLVFVLSSNPDEVVGKIANFAESEKTVSSVNQLGRVVAERLKADVVAEEAAQNVRKQTDAVIDRQISAALTALGSKPTRQQVITEIDTLLSVVNAVRP